MNNSKKERRLMKDKPADYIVLMIGLFMLIGFISFFTLYMHNVSIGNWISKEKYTSTEEWYKQMGLFIATFSGFSYFFSIAIDIFIQGLPKHNRKKKSNTKY